MSDLRSLIEHEIPEGRQSLESSYANLERVAAYCEANYHQAQNKQVALDETKKYVIQSLASVSYQINTLAGNLLGMLDIQTEKLFDLESQVKNVAEKVDVHKEKVARREIGNLSTAKVTSRQHKIVQNGPPEKQMRYQRQRINEHILDDIGHGVHGGGSSSRMPNVGRTGSTASSSSSTGSSALLQQQQYMYGQHLQANDTYAQGLYSDRIGTISRSTGKDYKPPVTIAPPTAPISQHANSAEMLQRAYPHMVRPPAPHGYSGNHHGQPSLSARFSANVGNVSSTPPADYSASPITPRNNMHDDSFPPPPIDFMHDADDAPLPPPPPAMQLQLEQYARMSSMDGGQQMVMGTPRLSMDGQQTLTRNQTQQPQQPQQQYVEKVVAMFDYQADKADELSFAENSIIYVSRKNEDGWYEGTCNGVTGLFPGNYVVPCL